MKRARTQRTSKAPRRAAEATHVEVGGRTLRLSNLDKVLYPASGTIKAEVIEYYARIAPAMLPHLRGRPVTLKRYPDGVEGEFFYEKQCPRHRPEWLATGRVKRETKPGWIEYCILNDEPSLVWAANLAALELHTHLHLTKNIDQPTMIAFDLDPGEPAGLRECARIALRLREMLAQWKLEGFVKASGGKGLHFCLPLNTKVSYDITGPFAKSLALIVERERPAEVTSNMSKAKRPGKVFIDWSQNSRYKTTVCAYSLRARTKPSVSIPLRWEEVESLARQRKPGGLKMSPADALKRVQKHGDLFASVLSLKQRLPAMKG